MTNKQIHDIFAETLKKISNDLSLDYDQFLHINSIYLNKPYLFILNNKSELSINILNSNVDNENQQYSNENIQKTRIGYINQNYKNISFYYTNDSLIKDNNNNLYYKNDQNKIILISCLNNSILIDYDEISYNCFNYLIENDISISNNINKINEFTFLNNVNLQFIKIPKNIIKISESAFENCVNLKNIIFNDKLEKISDYAFSNCSSLTNIDLSNTHVTSIYENIFHNCINLKSIKFSKSLNFLELSFINDCIRLNIIDLTECIPFEIMVHNNLLDSLKSKHFTFFVNEFDKYTWIQLNEKIFNFFEIKRKQKI